MLCAAHLLLLAQKAGKVDTPTPKSYQQAPVVERSIDIRFPLPAKPEPERASASFRRNDHYAVWDSRGLTIRHGDRTRTTLLEDVPTSPRLFSKDEILQTAERVRAGRRQRAAAALSGAIRIGGDAYFLIRWEDPSSGPWTEALVRVPLSGSNLWPEVVGRFAGISIAFRKVDDRLFLLSDKIATVLRQGKGWGVGIFDLRARTFSYRQLGAELLSYMPTGRKTGVFVEKTTYGTRLAARVDLGSGQRKPVFEGRGFVRFLDAMNPPIVISSESDEIRLHNADTGAQMGVQPGSGVARTGQHVLVWFPKEKPSAITLYDPTRWKVLGRGTGNGR